VNAIRPLHIFYFDLHGEFNLFMWNLLMLWF